MSDGSVYVDASFKSQEGLNMVVGRLLVGHADVIRADEFGLDVITSFVVTPFGNTPVGSIGGNEGAKIIVMTGSLGSGDNKGSSNYVNIRKFQFNNYLPATGTLVMGSEAGSSRASYIATGY